MDTFSTIADVALIFTVFWLIFKVASLENKVSKIQYAVFPALRRIKKP